MTWESPGGSYGNLMSASNESSSLMPPLIDDVTRQWFAVQTRFRFEKKVALQSSQKDLEVYLPLLTETHGWSDRRTTVTIPLFPGYAFVNIDQSLTARRAVVQTVGLTGFVSFGGTVVPIPSKQIENLQLLLQKKAPYSL